ncbi:MAG: response regulator [Terracidiphilus sp.]|jgi:CheY-like chemotaxis protein
MVNIRATLLIADDEPFIRLALSQALTEIGYSVRCAEDGFSTLRELRKGVPDFLLSDLNMPRMSGFELLSVVRRRFSSIRTIAMSGSFSGDEVPSGVAADGFYQKGSSVTALLRIMETLTRSQRPAYQSSSSDAPLWIHRDSHDTSPDALVTINCPECLRSFPHALGSGYLRRTTDCIYCRTSIHFAIAPHEDRMPSQAYERQTAAVLRFPQRESSLNC